MTHGAAARFALLCLPGLLGLLAASAAPTAAAATTDLAPKTFAVSLDDKPIGEHRFGFAAAAGDERQVTSDASFDVRLLGIVVYRYRHHAVEHWRGDCLASIEARTDENGKTTEVHEVADADGPLTGCIMSFAYWNMGMLKQTQLLNAQTGKLEPVAIVSKGNGEVEAHGSRIAAARWRISGPVHPIDVWYAADGQWVGLDSTVAGGRHLSYRLK